MQWNFKKLVSLLIVLEQHNYSSEMFDASKNFQIPFNLIILNINWIVFFMLSLYTILMKKGASANSLIINSIINWLIKSSGKTAEYLIIILNIELCNRKKFHTLVRQLISVECVWKVSLQRNNFEYTIPTICIRTCECIASANSEYFWNNCLWTGAWWKVWSVK